MMSTDLIEIIFFVLLLGMRHGLDLDHLAAIDAITRNVSHQKQLVKIVGCLFSIGHGGVVIVVSMMVGISMKLLQLPMSLGIYMQITSIAFLFLFSLTNFYSVIRGIIIPEAKITNLKYIIFHKLLKNVHRPVAILGVGGIFAISFDTVSQVTFFSLNSATIYGWIVSVVLGIIFMSGMILTDGINGYFVSLIIRRADHLSQFVSRLLGIIIGLFGLAMSIEEALKLI